MSVKESRDVILNALRDRRFINELERKYLEHIGALLEKVSVDDAYIAFLDMDEKIRIVRSGMHQATIDPSSLN